MARMLRVPVLLGCMTVLLGLSGGMADDKKDTPKKMTRVAIGGATKNRGPVVVKRITGVEYAELEIKPPTLVVKAQGEVETTGWKAELVRVLYVIPPKDGIQDFYLMATRPAGGAATVISTVEAKYEWKQYMQEAPWIKGFRVHGVDDGVVEVRFGGK